MQKKQINQQKISVMSNETSRKINSEKSILLLSMTKSGSHWMTYLITNYIYSIRNYSFNNLNSEERVNKIFNHRNSVLWFDGKINEPIFKIENHNDGYLFRQHINNADNILPFFRGKKIILYRNPRDWLISSHLYKNRFSKRKTKSFSIKYIPKNLSQSIDYLMPDFCFNYNALKRHYSEDRDLWISYEEMHNNIETTLKKIIPFIGLEIIESKILDTIKNSNYKKIQEEEKEGMHIDHLKKSFIRNIKTKQWEELLSKRSIKKIDNYLLKNNIDKKDFIF